MTPLTDGDREKAAILVSRWLEGNISSQEFEDEWPEDSGDLAVIDIGRELWCHYNDNPSEHLDVSNLSPEEV